MPHATADPGRFFDLLFVAGFGFGLYFFIKGFRVYWKYRVLEDTPQMAIRGVPMGFVHIYGKARGERSLTSPVTKTPCYLFKVIIERWETDSKDRGYWHPYRVDTDAVRFYLEDSTGKVQVYPRGAELDLPQTARVQIGGTGEAAYAGSGASPAELEGYVGGVGTIAATGESSEEMRREQYALDLIRQIGMGRVRSSSSMYRLTEYCILPDQWYGVMGTCVENHLPQDENDRNLIVKGRSEDTFLISWKGEKELEGNLRGKSLRYVFGGAALAVVCLGILVARVG